MVSCAPAATPKQLMALTHSVLAGIARLELVHVTALHTLGQADPHDRLGQGSGGRDQALGTGACHLQQPPQQRLTTVLWGHDTKKHKVNKQEESSLEALKSSGAG
jgi:hypothetical protein